MLKYPIWMLVPLLVSCLERLVFSPTHTPFSRDISQSLAPLGQARDLGKWIYSVHAAE